MTVVKRGFGRILVKDKRDKEYPVKELLARTKPKKSPYIYWANDGWWGDQLDTPQCVAFSWVHWLEDGPVSQQGVAPIVRPSDLYVKARELDEIEGEDYEGTTIRGGAKALVELGYIEEYRWVSSGAKGFNELVNTVLSLGPVVVGTNWYPSMDDPQPNELLKVAGKTPSGGHAYVLNGVNTKLKRFRMKNSWGRSWGIDGHAYIGFTEMARLLKEDGEACLAVEISK